MVELFWLLLPVAALSGWWIGRRGTGRHRANGGPLRQDYFQGLNYLLNEQPDKAIEVFTRMVQVDSDTVETHLALGNLFRRRGEVDRAIRIHQNLIARPTLSRDQRTYALLALGEDYLRAGLLDRAESLFQEVVDLNAHVEAALRSLLEIYQQEKEWDRAIDVAERLEARTGQLMRRQVAQFHCELAERERDRGEINNARQCLRRALKADPNCVRASVLVGELERSLGNHEGAVEALTRIVQQDAEFLPVVLDDLGESYAVLDAEDRFQRFLAAVPEQARGASVILRQTELVRKREGDEAAQRFLVETLRRHPSVRGLDQLIQFNLNADGDADSTELSVLHDLFSRLLQDKPMYACHQCGFSARALHWQCPGCRSWASIRPIRGVEGE
ncbi:lipopolysaccharide assembly protein LapB [Methylonatrum kenyense]|uniref:lipopolysaccharide assembly protein LapB n=1 Tax=Methylonatrum kenyense TaxID=455253 RepID=UPI0020BD9742|nr:lipopolysaccharide assembly protein LapB [Methylonatrum kenyense]MCK8515978.1 lipopolysaccharide assembly protein LapB [Methylonatrum kenyense]